MPRINYGMGAIGAALPALEDAAYQQESLSQALQQQKMAAAQRQMDFDQAVTIFKIKDSQVVRQLEQRRIDQHERSQGIAWRNQIAAMGGRALPQGEQAGPDDIVQVDPFTGDQFAYKNPEVAKREQATRIEENKYRDDGYVIADANAPTDAASVTLADGRKMYKPLVSYDLTKGAGMASYFGDRLKAFQDDQANLETWAEKEYTAKLAQYKAYAATAKGDAKTTVEAQIAGMESAKAETLARFKQEEKDRLGRAFVFWQSRYDKPVNLKDVPPEFMPPGFQDGGQSVQVPPPSTPIETPDGRRVRSYEGGMADETLPDGTHRFTVGNREYAILPENGAQETATLLATAMQLPGVKEKMSPDQAKVFVATQVLPPADIVGMDPETYAAYTMALSVIALGDANRMETAQRTYDMIIADIAKKHRKAQ